jgi:hypothetical protein
VKRVEKKQVIFGEAWEDALRLALLIRDGSLPDKAHRIETDWVDAATPTPAATADALVKYIAAGSIPAASDVTLQRAGFSAVERSRLEQDRALDQGASFLQEIAHSLTAKAAKVDKSLEADASAPASSPAVAVPTPNVMPKKVPVSGAGN